MKILVRVEIVTYRLAKPINSNGRGSDCAGEIDSNKLPIGLPQKAVWAVIRIKDVSRYPPSAIDRLRQCPLICSETRPRSVERQNRSILFAQEPMVDVVCVPI